MELSLLTNGIGTSKGLRTGLLALLLLTLLSGLILGQNDWDAEAFVMMGARFRDGDLAGNLGYDGQFVYYIASDPLNAAAHIDEPAYRYQRILYPLLSWIFSLGGDPGLLPWAMLLINILAAAAACGILGELLQKKGVEAWHSVAFLFSAGVLIALRADLNEPLAIFFSLLGMALTFEKKWSWAGLAFALGILAKETAAPFAIGAAAWLFFERRLRPGLIVLTTSLLPAMLWGLILTFWLGQSPLGAEQAGMEAVPFYGLLFIGVSPAKAIILLWVAFPTILLGLAGTWDLLRKKMSLELFILLANVALIAFMPRLTWYNAAGALRAVIGLAAISLVYTAMRRPRLLPWAGAFWLTSGLVLIPILIMGPYVN